MAGNVANIMDPNEEATAALYLKTPLLTNEEMAVVKSLMSKKLRAATLSMLYPVNSGAEGMETAIESLCIDALKAIKNGANILVLSDRGVNSRMAAIPALLASAALHHYLIDKTVRSDVGSSSNRANRGKSTTSARSSATASRPSTPTSPSNPSRN